MGFVCLYLAHWAKLSKVKIITKGGRNNWFKIKTLGRVLIHLEEFTEYSLV